MFSQLRIFISPHDSLVSFYILSDWQSFHKHASCFESKQKKALEILTFNNNIFYEIEFIINELTKRFEWTMHFGRIKARKWGQWLQHLKNLMKEKTKLKKLRLVRYIHYNEFQVYINYDAGQMRHM